MIETHLFSHPLEETAFDEVTKTVNFKSVLEDQYIHFEEKKRKPDLLGKTVKVSERQFPEVFYIVKKIEQRTRLKMPDIFVYEDFFYAIESKGIDNPWIEVSASMITDFTEKELEFMLAREICRVYYKHTHYTTLMNESLEMYAKGLIPFSNGIVGDVAKVIFYRWNRLANYSADCFGYLICMDLHASTKSILKCVLNSKFLANNINLAEYLKQAEAINELHDSVYESTKIDEQYPYGPFRIKNLIAFASSERMIRANKQLKNFKEVGQ
ncbi:M48 family metallopeptidase [Bacillus massiliigorillae]|uniref:M48 family metallopeptidase n=1 Tax=Bacillus massiliigorillae TaxID=1243664 RepID=UPI000399C913|nr:M48 family metallopeptidase [Bacillus massiliigorillae]